MSEVSAILRLQVKEEVSAAMRKARQEMLQFQQGSKQTENFARDLFRQFTAASLAVNAFYQGMDFLKQAFTQPIIQAGNFEAILARISTVLEGSTQQSIQALGDQVLNLSKSFPKSPEELGMGLYTVLQSGVSDSAEAMKVLTISTKAAVGGVTEVGTAAKVMTDIMGAYKLSVDKTVEVMDDVFVGAQRGKAEFSDLAGSLGNTLHSAAQLNIQIPEVVAAIETMVNAGLSSDEAATALNAFFTSVIQASKGTGDAADLAKQLGLAFDSTALRGKGLQKFMEDMAAKVGDNEVAMNILSGNVRGFRAATSIGGKGAEFFSDTLDEMRTKTGAMDEAFNKINNTLQSKWTIAINKMRSSILSGALEEIPAMKDAVDDLSKSMDENDEAIRQASQAFSESLVGAFQEVVDNAPTLIDALTAIANVAGLAVATLGGFIDKAYKIGGYMSASGLKLRAAFGDEAAGSHADQLAKDGYDPRVMDRQLKEGLALAEANAALQEQNRIGIGKGRIAPSETEVKNIQKGTAAAKDHQKTLDDVRDAMKSLGDDYDQATKKMAENLADLETSHKDRMKGIRDEISKVYTSLDDLRRKYKETTSDFERDTADSAVKQQEKVKELEKKLADLNLEKERFSSQGLGIEVGLSDDIQQVTADLERERAALSKFTGSTVGISLSPEIARRGALTDFEREGEDRNTRFGRDTAEFERNQELARQELDQLNQKKILEAEAYAIQRQELQSTTIALQFFHNDYQAKMQDMNKLTKDNVAEMKRNLQELQQTLTQAQVTQRAIGNISSGATERREANAQAAGDPLGITIGSITVTNEADEDRLIQKLTRLLQLQQSKAN